MKLVRYLIIALVMLLLSGTNVFASGTKDVSFRANISKDNITVEETTITGEFDNSNLQVQVIKKVGEQSTVLYTGRLGDYENGKYSDVDFNSIQILAVIDYNALFGDAEQEVIYIIPQKTQSEYTKTTMQTNKNITTAENTVELQSALTTQTIQTNISLMYNDKYCENVLLPGETLNVPVSITNSGTTPVEIVSYIAEYDLSGRLIDLTQGSVINAPANQTVTATLSNEFSADVACTAKVFIWHKDNLKPILNSICLQTQPIDYYADTYENAQNYDITKVINGRIDSVNDIDYIKFVPDISGKYVIHAKSEVNVLGSLYGAQNNLIVSGDSFNGGYYCALELVSGNTYYLKTTGSAIGEYDITFSKMHDDSFIQITNDTIKFTKNCDNSSQVCVNLYSSGEIVQNVVLTPSNNEISVEFNVDDLQSTYTITTVENNVITALYDLKAIEVSKIYNVTSKSYVSVPINVFNVSDISDIYFSLVFNESEFSAFDVCEYTYTTAETGTGLISDAEVDIKAIKNNAIVFKSTKMLTEPWSGKVNTIKLQALNDGEYSVKTIVYSVK